jgi:hypothetical protein
MDRMVWQTARRRLALTLLALLALPAAASGIGFEVWLVDQSDSPGTTWGGRIHVFEGRDLRGRQLAEVTPAAVIDLAGETDALCMAQTQAHPVRPHMLFFDSSHSHAVLAFVASGHVVVFDAVRRRPVACLRSSVGAGGARQAHAAVPSPDDRYILVANQNGKLLERIAADFPGRRFALDPEATLDLAGCTTPSGAPCQQAGLRPDNAPICPLIEATGRLAFVTLRGGGLFVVDAAATPMRIVGEYDAATVHGNGCGGVETGGSMYLDSGGGTTANLAEFDVYRFRTSGYRPGRPNLPAPALLFSDDETHERDAHGMAATRTGRHVWVADRHGNLAEVFDAGTGRRVATVDLTSRFSDDPSPDLLDGSPAGDRMFISLRGSVPLSGDPHASTGGSPGLMVVRLREGGRSGVVEGIVPVSNRDAAGVERADPHGLRVRLK